MIKKILKFAFAFLIFIGVLFLLFKTITPQDIVYATKTMSWFFVGEVVLFCLAISFIKTVRFYLLSKKANINLSFGQSLKIFFSSQSMSFLPGGEVVRGALLKIETGKKAVIVSGPVVAQAFVELVSAIIIVLIGSLVYRVFVSASVILLFVLFFTVMFLFKPEWLKKMFRYVNKITWMKSTFENAFKMQKEVQQTLLNIRNKPDFFTLIVFSLGVFAHVIGGLFIFFISSVLGITLPIIFSIFLYSTSVVIQGVLAIVPGGLGVTEGGILGLLTIWGTPASKSIILIILFRIGTLIFPVLLGVVLVIIFYSKYLFMGRKVLY